MSTKLDAPQQFKQPSRKGKKAWRKNVDVTEVQEGLRQLKDEEIKGYVECLHKCFNYKMIEALANLFFVFSQWPCV